ncbi:M50 family metallopeptidase [Candidatus Woesearchaeota archaeon]|nr:M50 family metallopeptidase [Candidatus Woesearchaeota archaeon]
MVLFTFQELLDLAIMVVGLGYIFMGFVRLPRPTDEFFQHQGFDWKGFQFAILITAPAIVLHELAHKFVAMFFGLLATFHASYFGLGLGIFLRLIQSPFIIFVPGFVAIQGASPLERAITAFVGPGINLLLFGIAWYFLHHAPRLTYRQKFLWHATKQINLFLFLFNMIPIPPFDGFGVVSGLLATFF